MFYRHKYGVVNVNFVQRKWSVRVDAPFTFGEGDVYTTKFNLDRAYMIEDALRDCGFIKDVQIITHYDYDEDEYDVLHIVAKTGKYTIYFDDGGNIDILRFDDNRNIVFLAR